MHMAASAPWSPDGGMLAFSKGAIGQINGLQTAVIATVDLATIMMADSGRIQESDAVFVNKKRATRGEEPLRFLGY